jgi:hypothetical protein
VTVCGRSEDTLGGMTVRRAGTSELSSAPVAAPRARTAAATRSSRSRTHAARSPSTGGRVPLRSNLATSCRRSAAARGVLTAVWTIGTSSLGNRNSVRRIAIQRTKDRRPYIASATSPRVVPALRASTER